MSNLSIPFLSSRGSPWRSSFPGLLRVLAMTLGAILLLISAKTAQASVFHKAPNNLGLVGYWSFEDGVGLKATDFSGNGNTGTLINGPVWTTAGKIGKALNFTAASGQYVAIPDSNSLDVTTAFTISVWTNGTSYVAKNDTDTTGAYIFYAQVGTVPILTIRGIEAITDTGSNCGTAGQWAHFTVVHVGTNYAFYCNGTLNSNVTSSNNPSSLSTGLMVGYYGEFSAYANGATDEVRIYNRALGATEVAALYNAGGAAIKNSAQGLVGLWQFDEMAGTTVTDKTGRGSNGTLLPVPTSISRVQYNHTYPGTSGASLAFNSAVTSGNLIIVATSGSGGSISTVGDNCSNTYAQAVAGSVGITSSAIWYAYNVNGGTCTVTVTSTMSDFGMSIFEYAGTSAGDPLLTTHTDLQKKAGTAFSTTADGMVFVHWANESAGADATGYGSGWSGIQHDTSHYDLQEENITATAGSYTPSVGGADQGSDVLLAAAFRGLNRPSWTTGKYGGAVKFDGIDDLVGIGDKSDLRVESRPFTLAAWVNVAVQPSTGQGAIIIAKGNGGSGGYGLQYVNSGGTYQLSLTKYGVVDQLINQTLSLNTWYHIAAVQTATQVEYFINGASIGTYSNSSSYASSSGFNFNIGIMSNNSANPWNGLIDDVRVYNRALSAQEIANLYNSSGEGYAVINASMNNLFINGLVGLWSFNGPDMTNTTSTDRSGLGNDGTLVNGPVKVIGVNGQALRFSSGKSISLSTSAFDLSSISFSIAAWFKTSATTANLGIYTKTGATTRIKIYTTGTGDILRFRLVNSSGTGISADTDPAVPINDGQWHHVVAMYNANSTFMSVYLDGVLRGGASGPSGDLDASPSIHLIGQGDGGSVESWNGDLDEVRVYNRLLSVSEIQQLYSIGR